jgi:hypothetical protein
MERALTQLKPGDIIEWRDQKFGAHRRWKVHGIHLGGDGQESVISLEAVDRSPAWDEVHLPLMWVPECLTRQCRIAASRLTAEARS